MSPNIEPAGRPKASKRSRRIVRACCLLVAMTGAVLALWGLFGIGGMVLDYFLESIPFSQHVGPSEDSHRFRVMIRAGALQAVWGTWFARRERIGALGAVLGLAASAAIMAWVRTRTGGVRWEIVGVEVAVLAGIAWCVFLEWRTGRRDAKSAAHM